MLKGVLSVELLLTLDGMGLRLMACLDGLLGLGFVLDWEALEGALEARGREAGWDILPSIDSISSVQADNSALEGVRTMCVCVELVGWKWGLS